MAKFKYLSTELKAVKCKVVNRQILQRKQILGIKLINSKHVSISKNLGCCFGLLGLNLSPLHLGGLLEVVGHLGVDVLADFSMGDGSG